jgi:hypothetical protein
LTDLAASDWPYSYPPARVYQDAEWAVEMGWYSRAELTPPVQPLTTWHVGDTATFIYRDSDDDREITAVLRSITPHFYMWFEEGTDVSDSDIAWAAEQAEHSVYAKVHTLFGEEWSPGVDGDPHIFVLHLAQLSRDSYGQFGSLDECPVALCTYSNGHEMIYVTLDGLGVGTDEYLGVLAHELQHLIRYHVDGNESTWLDEGFSTLAETLSGHDNIADDFVSEFLADPDLQLNHWRTDKDEPVNYGASYLFSLYLYERFGEGFIRNLAQQPQDDMTGVEVTLREHTSLSLDEVFGEWTVANLLDDSTLADGRFGYTHEKLTSLKFSASHAEYPLDASGTVHQYAADYIAFNVQDDLRLTFDGSDQTALLTTKAHSGHRFWWSNRLDNSIASLQTEIDLARWQGKSVLFRIQYITDNAVSSPGFALDDFVLESLEGVQRRQDFEAHADGWQARGFVYAGDAVRQQWAVYLVTLGDEPMVTRLTLNDRNQGEIVIPADGNLKRSILVVAALAPFTLETASYTYQATVIP